MKPFNSIARLLILLLFASQFSANYAEKKIFVVSDIHVMDSSLLDSPKSSFKSIPTWSSSQET